MAKCDKCLRGTQISVTGVDPSNTLKIDIGGAVLYVMPAKDGGIKVEVNTQNLIDGDYAISSWNGERWSISTMKEK